MFPFFDTAVAMLRRKLRGKGIGEADSGHIHHRLQQRGLSRKQTLLVMVSLSIAMALAAFVADVIHNDFVAAILCLSLLASLVVGRVFGHHEAVMLVRHIKAIGVLSLDLIRISGSRVMMVRLEDHEITQEFNAWDMVCERIACRGIHSLEFSCRQNGDEMGQLNWQCSTSHLDGASQWELRFSSQLDDGVTTYLNVCGNSKSSPVSAGRR